MGETDLQPTENTHENTPSFKNVEGNEGDSHELIPETEVLILEIPVLLNLTKVYSESDPQKSIEYGKRAVELAQNLGNKIAEAEALSSIADCRVFAGHLCAKLA